MIKAIAVLLELLGEALAGRRTEEDLAKDLIDAAFASGVPSATLAKHLSAKAAADAEFAADLAQYLKTGKAPP